MPANESYSINFGNSIDNISIQPGDTVFAVEYGSMSSMSTTAGNIPKKVGIVESVVGATLSVAGTSDGVAPSAEDFIFFVKNPVINTSSLKGYYADVTFTNDSTERAELYAVSAEIVESSK